MTSKKQQFFHGAFRTNWISPLFLVISSGAWLVAYQSLAQILVSSVEFAISAPWLICALNYRRQKRKTTRAQYELDAIKAEQELEAMIARHNAGGYPPPLSTFYHSYYTDRRGRRRRY